jgi:ubiquinone/menaquinone biosynthesis C-methylase UbiE
VPSIFDRKPILPAKREPPKQEDKQERTEFAPGASMLGQLAMVLAQAIYPQPRDRALDVNCGAGHVAFALSLFIGAGGRVVGVESSPELLDEARRRKAVATFSEVELYAMQPDRLVFPSGGFSLVTCGMGLPSFQDPAAALKEMHRVLQPGGWIGLTVPHPGGMLLDELPAPDLSGVATAIGGLPAVPPPAHLGLWTEQTVAELLVATGFNAVHVQVMRRTAVYRTVDEWWRDGAMTPLGTPQLLPAAARAPVPEQLAAAFRERLRGRFLRIPFAVTVALARRGGSIR